MGQATREFDRVALRDQQLHRCEVDGRVVGRQPHELVLVELVLLLQGAHLLALALARLMLVQQRQPEHEISRQLRAQRRHDHDLRPVREVGVAAVDADAEFDRFAAIGAQQRLDRLLDLRHHRGHVFRPRQRLGADSARHTRQQLRWRAMQQAQQQLPKSVWRKTANDASRAQQ